MSVNRKKYNRKLIGPGGWHCPCCAPPRSLSKRYKRLLKHIFNRKELKFELDNSFEGDE